MNPASQPDSDSERQPPGEPDRIVWRSTHCGRMDHGGCGIRVGVRQNRIVAIKGDPDGILNRGYICAKGLASADKLNHPRRLRQPLRRVGRRGDGRWQAIGWPEALDTIAARLSHIREAHGAREVAFCQGMPKGLEHMVLIRLANLFGSPNVVAVQDVCHAPREIAGRHTCGFYPVVDFQHPSRLVVLWGSNPLATNEEGAVCRRLMDQIRGGTELMVVDPRRTELADRASVYLPIRPGTDAALALAFLQVIISESRVAHRFVDRWTFGFAELADQVRRYTPESVADVTGVSPDRIRMAARRYAAAHPAAVQWGNAVEQTTHAFHTARALICLMAVCGNLDVAGGNRAATEPPVAKPGRFVRAERMPTKRDDMLHAHHHTVKGLMTVPPAYFRKAVLERRPYPVRGAYIQCSNPVTGWADSRQTEAALRALDFLAVSDIVMTPTAALADVVLPAATQFEFDDIGHYGLGHGVLLARPQVVTPPDGCRSDMEILRELGVRLTGAADWPDASRGFLDEVLSPAGLTFDQFAEMGTLRGNVRFEKHLAGGFRTPTGKVELRLSRADALGAPPLPDFPGLPEPPDPNYPLVLTSAKDPFYLHSSYRWLERLRKRSPVPRAGIHPETAADYGIGHGSRIRIETAHGAVVQTARIDPRVRPGIVHAAYGWWDTPDTAPANLNRLTGTTRLGSAFGTPNLKGIGCRVRTVENDTGTTDIGLEEGASNR